MENVIYTHRAAFVGKVEEQIARYRNIALGFRYGGRREDEDGAISTGIKLCAIIGEGPRKPARLISKGKAV